jgi:hypothetical protein
MSTSRGKIIYNLPKRRWNWPPLEYPDAQLELYSCSPGKGLTIYGKDLQSKKFQYQISILLFSQRHTTNYPAWIKLRWLPLTTYWDLIKNMITGTSQVGNWITCDFTSSVCIYSSARIPGRLCCAQCCWWCRRIWNWHLQYKTASREHVLFAYNLCVQLIASVKTGRIRLPPPYSEARDEEIEKKVSSSIIGYTRYSANEARLLAVCSLIFVRHLLSSTNM